MCEKCYSYIYDLIISPLPTKHIMHGHINDKALKRCSHDIAECVSRALKNYVDDQGMIQCFNLLRENYESSITVLDMLESNTIPAESKEHHYDEWLWIQFKEILSSEFSDINHAIQLCMDNMIVKKIHCKEQFIEHFFMHKLRHLLTFLPGIHKEHTEKRGFPNGKSLGSVPQDKLDQIRIRAGLHVSESISIYIDDLYN